MNEIITNLCSYISLPASYLKISFRPKKVVSCCCKEVAVGRQVGNPRLCSSKQTNYLIILELLLGERGHFVTHGPAVFVVKCAATNKRRPSYF